MVMDLLAAVTINHIRWIWLAMKNYYTSIFRQTGRNHQIKWEDWLTMAFKRAHPVLGPIAHFRADTMREIGLRWLKIRKCILFL